ncbi:MAG: universal stress protein [Myxococcaceae bacterium]|nr:universal stress protein [Myxococcaceae bacterium]
MNRSILVPLDGSTHALSALPVGRELAKMEDATLQVLYLGPRALPPAELAAQLGLAPGDLRGAVIDQRAGDPGQQLLRAAAEQAGATLVMCTHAGEQTLGGVLGELGERVLGEATGPVVLVRPTRGVVQWQLRNVLLPHDGTPSTSWAIHEVAGLASRAGATLTVLHVAEPGKAPPAEPGSLPAPRYVDQQQHEWPAWANEFLGRLGSVFPIPPEKLRLFVARGEPGPEIVRRAAASNCDLIVLAWRGTLAPARAAVIKAVLREAPCPVMLLRTEVHPS